MRYSALLVAGLAFLIVGCWSPAPEAGAACRPEVDAAVREFPQYGNAEVSPTFPGEGHSSTSCEFSFAHHADGKEVIDYYERQLTQHGWDVVRPRYNVGRTHTYHRVNGKRDGFCYSVWVSAAIEKESPPGLVSIYADSTGKCDVLR